jgi:glutaredoxin
MPSSAPQTHAARRAVIYRMVTPEHVCPFGVAAVHLLRREGYELEDHHLTSRAETEAFKERQGVRTTPQIFVDGERIGGYDELREFLAPAGGNRS